MKKIIMFIVTFFFLSCKKDFEEIIQYDRSGKILSKKYISNSRKLPDSIMFFKNNEIKTKFIFKENNYKEFYVKYYKNKKIVSEGNVINKKRIGKWKFINHKANTLKIVEFKNICGDEYPNQEWNYRDKDKLDFNFSSFYYFKLKNTISRKGGTNYLTIKYVPMIKKETICMIHFSKEIDSLFCNVDKVKKDGFRLTDSLTFTLPLKFESRGKKNLRGFIEEHLFQDVKGSDYSNHKIRTVYFDIPIEVK